MDASVGDDDVEAAHRFLGFAEQSPHLRGFRKVSLNSHGFTALRRDRLDNLLRQSFAAGVIDDDCRTIGGQTFGDRPTNAARSTGDERSFPSRDRDMIPPC